MHWQKEAVLVPPVRVNADGRITSGIGWLVRLDGLKRPLWPTYLCDVKIDFGATQAFSFLVHANLGIRIIGKAHENEPIPEWILSLQRIWSELMETIVASDDKCFVCGGVGSADSALHVCALCHLCSHARCAQERMGDQPWAAAIANVASQRSFSFALPAPDHVCVLCQAAMK